ncbi:uncharacterized protein LOC135925397 [Gordionus sp. m RMFG-2023]|uniref:uncharacterized protein LOC135925397 n=1 Tax=Gordionus sp. m RMFG-2023 TaxID=3053472 RepID=UPI0031FCBF94
MYEQMSGNENYHYEDAIEIICIETTSSSTSIGTNLSCKKLIKKRDIDQDLFEQILEIEKTKGRLSTNSWINVMHGQTLAKRRERGKKKLIEIIFDILFNFDSDQE